MNYLGFGKALVMTNEELRKVINDEMERLDIKTVSEMIRQICADSDKHEPGVLRNADPVCRIAYMGREMYKLGFVFALHLYSDALKEAFTEMQARKDERESKRKGVNGNAEA